MKVEIQFDANELDEASSSLEKLAQLLEKVRRELEKTYNNTYVNLCKRFIYTPSDEKRYSEMTVEDIKKKVIDGFKSL